MDLITAFNENKVEGIESISKTIDTQLSRIYLGKTKAYKVYRRSAAFFGNLADDKYRFEFYSQDFSWNNLISPSVYIALKPVAFVKDKYIYVDSSKAQDFFIEMNLIDTENTFTSLLLNKKLKRKDIKKFVDNLYSLLCNLTNKKREELNKISKSWSELYNLRYKDLLEFSSLQSTIPQSLLKPAFENIKIHFEKSSYIANFSNKDLMASIDSHSDNVLVLNNDIIFIDSYLVEERWRLTDFYFNICRIAVDLVALGQPELVRVLYNYCSKKLYLSEDIKISYELNCAILKGSYNAIIGKNDLALLYVPIIKKHTSALKSINSKL